MKENSIRYFSVLVSHGLTIEHRTSSSPGLGAGRGWLKLALLCVIDTIILMSATRSFNSIGA